MKNSMFRMPPVVALMALQPFRLKRKGETAKIPPFYKEYHADDAVGGGGQAVCAAEIKASDITCLTHGQAEVFNILLADFPPEAEIQAMTGISTAEKDELLECRGIAVDVRALWERTHMEPSQQLFDPTTLRLRGPNPHERKQLAEASERAKRNFLVHYPGQTTFNAEAVFEVVQHEIHLITKLLVTLLNCRVSFRQREK